MEAKLAQARGRWESENTSTDLPEPHHHLLFLSPGHDKYRLNANTNNCREQRKVEEKCTVYISRSDALMDIFIFILMTCNSMKMLAFILVEMKCFQPVWLQDATRDS